MPQLEHVGLLRCVPGLSVPLSYFRSIYTPPLPHFTNPLPYTRVRARALSHHTQVVPGTIEDNVTITVDADFKGAEVKAPAGVNFAIRLVS